MTQLVKERPWSARLAAGIAAEVRRYRMAKGWSVRQLSDATAEAGLPLAREVLSNLETGRRPTISVAEVFVLASVLDVPPLLLMFPVGRVEAMEPLPGLEMSPWAALLAAERGSSPPYQSPVAMFRKHQTCVDEWERRSREVQERSAEAEDPSIDEDERAVAAAIVKDGNAAQDQAVMELRYVRQHIRAAGLTPPVLPAALTHLDREEVWT